MRASGGGSGAVVGAASEVRVAVVVAGAARGADDEWLCRHPDPASAMTAAPTAAAKHRCIQQGQPEKDCSSVIAEERDNFQPSSLMKLRLRVLGASCGPLAVTSAETVPAPAGWMLAMLNDSGS